MSWILPGLEILPSVKHVRARVIGDEYAKETAARARKALRQKLWDLKNPGRRRSYDSRLLERVNAWKKANPEKVLEIARRYAASDHGKEMIRAKTARYRARKKARLLERAA